jgi:hypothetical protein
MLRSVKKAWAVARTLAAMSFDESAVGDTVGETTAALVGVPAVEALALDGNSDARGLTDTDAGALLDTGIATTAAESGAAVPSALGWLTAVQPDSRARLIIAAAKAVRRSPTRATVREPRRPIGGVESYPQGEPAGS